VGNLFLDEMKSLCIAVIVNVRKIMCLDMITVVG